VHEYTLYVTYTRLSFSQIRHFRPMTEPNPLKTKISDPLPTQPNPRVNPTRGLTNPRTTL